LDPELQRVFGKYPGRSAAQLLEKFGWDVTPSTLLSHRRRLGHITPKERGRMDEMSHDKFWGQVERNALARYGG
jgi:hypothetical protein